MDAATRHLVRQRADERCEYCKLRQEHCELRHHIEHIIAKQHGGSDDDENLALACHRCNLHKGPNLTGIDPQTGLSPHFFILAAINGLSISQSAACTLSG